MVNYTTLRIVFLGTPDFAVASLAALCSAGCTIVAVITAPDKPAGRGLQLQQSAVKQFAVANNLPVLQPQKLKDPAFIETLKSLNADVQIVVAFRMLPEAVWNMPSMGTINLHAGLLPQYRGAAPINWVIINGEKETGVTTFLLQHEIDTGSILMQTPVIIKDDETAETLYDTLKNIGAELLVETIKKLSEYSLMPQPQQSLGLQALHHAPKIFTETCLIDFEKSVEDVHNLIRGLSPYPGAFTFFNGKKIKIFTSEKEIVNTINSITSDAITDSKTFLKFACSNGFIHAKEVQLEGKKKMPIIDFLRGLR